MSRATRLSILFLLCALIIDSVECLLLIRQLPQLSFWDNKSRYLLQHSFLLWAGRRYGPPLNDMGRDWIEDNRKHVHEQQKEDFRNLLDQVRSAAKPEYIPSLLTKKANFLLSMPSETAVEVVEALMREAMETGGEEEAQRVAEAVDLILSFTEEFVNQSKDMDDYNKNMLGRIVRTMTNREGTEREREERLDELIAKDRDNFSRSFLRHLDGEYERIASAPKISPESTRLQETLMVIKARVLEELGKGLGEGALVLGQLVAYEDKNERIAVLDAGLTVRGVEFAQELATLTEEALQGFASVPDGADPTLVGRVEEIDLRVKSYIFDNNDFQ